MTLLFIFILGSLIGFLLAKIINQKNAADARNLLKNILESSIEYSIIASNLKGEVIAWNKGATLTYGYSAEEMIHKNIRIFSAPEECASGHLQQVMNEVLSKGRAEAIVERVRRDGSRFTALVVVTLLKNNKGKVIGYLSVSRDITEKKAREEKLAQSLSLLQSILESSIQYSIVATDLQGRILSWNKGAELNYGYTEVEVLNNSADMLSRPEVARSGALQKLLTEAKAKGKCETTLERVRKDGSHFLASLTVTLRKNKRGEPLGFTVISKDITKQKELEQQLIKSNQELEQFAYVVSHDLKAPLRGIQNLISWIDKDPDTKYSEESKKYFDLLIGRTNRMAYLIEGILEYSRVGRTDTDISEVSVKEVIEEILDLIYIPPNFTIHYDKNLPTLLTAKVQLTQVFTNLISNAIKYHDKVSGHIEIGFADLNKDCYEFYVKDDGPGIDPQYHEQIFQIFQTLQSRDVIESAGVGLSIVKKLVEGNHGKIKVVSEVGKGANFIFTWPKHPIKKTNTLSEKNTLDVI